MYGVSKDHWDMEDHHVTLCLYLEPTTLAFDCCIGSCSSYTILLNHLLTVLDEIADVINKLTEGCELDGKKINIIIYADDIVVLGPTKWAIKKIMEVLTKKLEEKGLEVNMEKTVALEFNKVNKEIENDTIKIAGKEINWVSKVKYLGVILQSDLKWEKELKAIVNKMNKMGNMILQQVGKVVEQRDRVYLLNCCALDLYGLEFCDGISKKLFENAGKSYHWLIKRSIGENKFFGNHAACAESGLLTWNLMDVWKKNILWEKICGSENDILLLLFGDKKWETKLGKMIHDSVIEFGKNARNVKEMKENMKLVIEATAVLKEMERQEELDG